MPSPPLVTTLTPGVRVELKLTPIDDLLDAASNGFRLYELFRLQPPDDLVHYADVAVTCDTPEKLEWWPQDWLPEQRPAFWQTELEHPPWRVVGNEKSAEHQAWLRSGFAEQATKLAAARWPEIEAARALIGHTQDRLVRYELALIDSGKHENDIALQEPDLSPWLLRYFRWRHARHYTDADYRLLAALLASPVIDGFSHRGRGDWFAIKAACAEQFARTGGNLEDRNAAAEAFPIRVLAPWSGRSLCDPDDDTRLALNERPAWTRGVRFQYEGIQLAGLFLDEGGCGAQPMARYERSSLIEEVSVLLTQYDGVLTPLRHWYRAESGLLVGITPMVAPALATLLRSHGTTSLCTP